MQNTGLQNADLRAANTEPSQGAPRARQQNIASCNCGARWASGERTGHCGACHRTFKGTSAFDRHQKMLTERRNGRPFECIDPTTITTKDGEPVYETRTDRIGTTIYAIKREGVADWFREAS